MLLLKESKVTVSSFLAAMRLFLDGRRQPTVHEMQERFSRMTKGQLADAIIRLSHRAHVRRPILACSLNLRPHRLTYRILLLWVQVYHEQERADVLKMKQKQEKEEARKAREMVSVGLLSQEV